MIQKDKILYIGYGFNGEPGLDSLLQRGSFDIVGVVTPPLEAYWYRKHIPDGVLPVETLACKYNLPLIHTDSNQEIAKVIQATQPDSVMMCYYTKIIPEKMLEQVSFFNIHHGCGLPRLRGSSNTEWAVRNGINQITVSLFQVVHGLDEGDLYWEPVINITEDETIVDMRRKMNEVLRQGLGKVYEHILHPERSPELSKIVFKRPQKEEGATYVCSIREEDNMIDWNKPAQEIYNLIRSGCDPEVAPVYTFYQGKPLRVWGAQKIHSDKVWEGHIHGKPISITEAGVEVLTGDKNYTILLKDVEYEGQRGPAKTIITSIRDTLGISHIELYCTIASLEQRIKDLEK